jgi:phage terminase large subunit GpA-like protein
VKNTLLGELWEDRTSTVDKDDMLSRREYYGAELPDGVLVLTCGVDTQDNRLEYEVVGHGHGGETWGIKRGFMYGRPDTPEPWARLDDVIDHSYKYANGKALKISITCVDSGGHFTQEVYEECRARLNKHVFAIKGKGGEGIPYISPPSKVPIRDNKHVRCWLYTLGVDSGKTIIYDALTVQEEGGTKYCHFPSNEDRGYDTAYFDGLLSETTVLVKSNGGYKVKWEKLPGHERNEPLDLRNYALAGYRIVDPDLEAIERRLNGLEEKPVQPQPQKRQKHRRDLYGDEW